MLVLTHFDLFCVWFTNQKIKKISKNASNKVLSRPITYHWRDYNMYRPEQLYKCFPNRNTIVKPI